VPRPITGINSPVDGFGRDSIGVSGIVVTSSSDRARAELLPVSGRLSTI